MLGIPLQRLSGTAAKRWSISTRKSGLEEQPLSPAEGLNTRPCSPITTKKRRRAQSLRFLPYAYRIKTICPPYFYEGGRKMMIRIEKANPACRFSSNTVAS